jgi:MSHA biogenesis protein MshK
MAHGLTGLAGMLVLGMSAAQAGELRDPTRPPAALYQGKGTAVSSAPQLQSVMISPQRRAAIINGQTVELGDTYGGARLIRVGESEVVLKDGGSVQVLKLFPFVDKRERQDAPPALPGKTESKP